MWCITSDLSNMATQDSRLTMFGVILAFLFLAHLSAAADKPPAGKPPKMCGISADIALVLDSSSSIGPGDFNRKLMPFIKDLVSRFHISPEKVRFSLLTFGHELNRQHIFNFDEYSDEESLLNRIDTVKWLPGDYTRTDQAVAYARKTFFSKARPNVKKIEIIITDGKARGPKKNVKGDLAVSIKATKAMGVTIFAIGVGNKIDQGSLKAMATSEEHTFHAGSYSALQGIIGFLKGKLCKPPKTVCGDTDPDVVFAMDSSRMDVGDVRNVFKFITNVADKSKADKYKGVQIGLLTGECLDYRGFALGEFADKSTIGNYLDQLGQAVVAPLVKELTYEAFLEKNGGRKGARRVGVIVVPEKAKNHSAILAEALRAKQKGIEIFAIGIGTGNDDILRSIASSPSHVMRVSGNSVFESTVFEFVGKLCKPSITTVSPKSTPRPTQPTAGPTQPKSPPTQPNPGPTKKPGCD